MRRDKVVGIIDQLLLREPVNPSHDACGGNESQQEATDALDNRVDALQQHAHFEDAVNTLFVHLILITASSNAGVLNV